MMPFIVLGIYFFKDVENLPFFLVLYLFVG